LPTGNLRWRARTYNTNNVAGEWSNPVSIVGIGTPQAPVITNIVQSSRPTFNWQSTGQVGYQLQILSGNIIIYDTGEKVGIEKTFKSPLYLMNGSYTVKIRIINSSVIWSDWTTLDFTLAITPPNAPTITVSSIIDGARIFITDIDSSITHMYLMRDNILIADITGLSQYDDYTSIGSTNYMLRAVDSNDNYVDSSPITITVSVKGATLAAVDALNTVINIRKKALGQPTITRQKQIIGSGHHYAGREYPVYTISEFSSENYTAAYYYTTIPEWNALETEIYRIWYICWLVYCVICLYA